MKNLTCIPYQSSGKSRNTTLPKFIKVSPKEKRDRPNDLSICPVPSSPSLKNGGPFFVGFLSGFHAFAGMTKKVLAKPINPLARPVPSSPSLKNGGSILILDLLKTRRLKCHARMVLPNACNGIKFWALGFRYKTT